MDEIIPKLFIGTIQDAQTFDGETIVNVLEQLWDAEPRRSVWIPILMDGKAKQQQLNLVAMTIHSALANNHRVLVHCHQGIERSPLAVAYYLMIIKSLTMEQAYELIKQKRPIVEDRQSWLDFTP